MKKKDGEETDGELSEELNYLLCAEDEVRIDVSYAGTLQAPVAKGTKAGSVIYRVNGEAVQEFELVLKKDVARKNWRYMGMYILQEYLLAA